MSEETTPAPEESTEPIPQLPEDGWEAARTLVIEFEVSHFYDWAPLEDGDSIEFKADDAGREKPHCRLADGTLVPALVKQKDGGDEYAKRVVRSAQDVHGTPTTFTTIHVPHEALTAMHRSYNEGNQLRGRQKTRNQMLGFHLEETVMPHHAHPDHWVNIHCSDPDAERYLRRRLLPDDPDSSPASPAPQGPSGPASGMSRRRAASRYDSRKSWHDLSTSIFSMKVMRGDDVVKDWDFHCNLRTNPTRGGGVIGGVDWQAALMSSADGYTGTGANVSYTATSMTDTGAAFPTGASDLTGRVIWSGAVYGVIMKNTATVVTVDKWHSATAPGTTGSTPAANATYAIGGYARAFYLALSSDGTAPASGDQYLAGEFISSTDSGLVRAVATYAHTAGQMSFTLSNTYTSNPAGASSNINKGAVAASSWDGATNYASSGIAHGPMIFEAAEPSPPQVVAGDTCAQTVTVSI
jgi:hypothetical protein